jgi:peroxiredoxin
VSRLSSATLRIGDWAPDFELPALGGEIVTLHQAAAGCRLLVLLLEPGSWSPAARRQISELNAAHERLAEAGIGVLVVATEEHQALWRRFNGLDVPFPVLADETRDVARDLGVFQAWSWQGIGVTRPAVFFIDPERRVRFIYLGHGERDVPDTESLIHLALSIVAAQPAVASPAPPKAPEVPADQPPAAEVLEATPVALESAPPQEEAVPAVDLLPEAPLAETADGEEQAVPAQAALPLGEVASADAQPPPVTDLQPATDATTTVEVETSEPVGAAQVVRGRTRRGGES